ncbi:hypothetical protein [Flammeovirga aprica]|uniref:DUF4293 family protein n=1 Tax=Flammeovirga aprica JL-4 TaxID=694437 RepID=A0A7X9RWT1_9BACT|nr:hypothetical protein [Flammeovirga aprica]NME70129.1 hypothetical protein [Flammeovirga aprica JL-4]
MNSKIGNVTTYLASFILLIMGVVYLFKNSFMPYHSEAVMLEWSEVDQNFQALILALMRAVAGGFVTIALAIVFLQKKFSSTKISWLPALILFMGLTISFTSIYANVLVRLNTEGKPPTALAFLGVGLVIAGYIFNLKSLKEVSNSVDNKTENAVENLA